MLELLSFYEPSDSLFFLKHDLLYGLTLSILHCSEITAEGRRITKLDQILLNGNNIAIVSDNHSFNVYMPLFREVMSL